MKNLIDASKQWQSRPFDQRFATLQDLKKSVQARRDISHESILKAKELTLTPKGSDIMLKSPIGDYEFTNWSFNQLCKMVKAPSQYITSLSPELACANMNYALSKKLSEVKLLETKNGHREVRSLDSTTYGRIWDIDVVKAVESLISGNSSWHNPPAREVKVNGQTCQNAGLYGSDRDVFMFMVDDKHTIEIGKEKLNRGFFVWNSEVGKTSFGLTTFLYRSVCGNHIVWGAQEINEVRIRHSENCLVNAFFNMYPAIESYMKSSTQKEVAAIKKAQDFVPAIGKEKVTEWLFGRGFSKSTSQMVFERIETEEKTDKPSVWNLVNGLTAVARDTAHIDSRLEMERKIGSLMSIMN